MSAFGKEQLEARLRRCELHCLEEMQVVLRTLCGIHYMPVAVRDVITLATRWSMSIGIDARVDVVDEEPPTPIELEDILWEDQPTPIKDPNKQ